MGRDKLINSNSKSQFMDRFNFLDETKNGSYYWSQRENFGLGFKNICIAIKTLASEFFFVYPVHLNPNVRNVVLKQLSSLS